MKPIVYLGPSLPREEAEKYLDADYRPPVRRGDLEQVEGGRVVGVIDGVFDGALAISPTEIRNAVRRGVRVLGSSSMGALRATEVPEMEGVGRVYRMYKDGLIEDDDEVAIIFDPDTFRPLSEPMVNIRHAVERLTTSGTLSREVGGLLLSTAKRLPYADRTYRNILARAGLSQRADADVLLDLLRLNDLKRDDAISLLETLPGVEAGRRRRGQRRRRAAAPVKLRARVEPDAPVFFWEFGERVPFSAVIQFLKLTGEFPALARRGLAEGAGADRLDRGADGADVAERVLRLRARWGWISAEEVRVTLRDLGLGTEDLQAAVERESSRERRLRELTRRPDARILRTLRASLLLDDLALKRAATRHASFHFWARRGEPGAPSEAERTRAREQICEWHHARSWPLVLDTLQRWGVEPTETERFAHQLALARRAALAFVRGVEDGAKGPAFRLPKRLGLRSRPKPPGDRRFSLPTSKALAMAEKLRPVVGITRVGVITGLDVVGLPNVSCFRPAGRWSSTIGSGKGTSLEGAKAGAIMEEVEKWAQEQFPGESARSKELELSFEALARRERAVDPALLDLPHDSIYRPDLRIGWRPVVDMLTGERLFVPSAALRFDRLPRDIYFSAWAGRKIFTTNGLASGFTLEDAVLHATCEYLERHARVSFEILGQNPGVPGPVRHAEIDLATTPASTQRIVSRLRRVGEPRLVQMVCEVGVPALWAYVLRAYDAPGTWYGAERVMGSGHACHPDPEVAANMALLEASQTMMVNIQGGREDLTVLGRSLGRHERSSAQTLASFERWRSLAGRQVPFASVAGFVSRDVRRDVEWTLARIREAGVPLALLADLSLPSIAPARVVRVLLPGLETTNPARTGPRARLGLIADLLLSER